VLLAVVSTLLSANACFLICAQKYKEKFTVNFAVLFE